MPTTQRLMRMPKLRDLGAPLIVLAVALIGTLLGWRLATIAVEDSLRSQFNRVVDTTVEAVQMRMRGYEQVLRGGAGLFAASDDVTRIEWREYVAKLRISETYPGVRGVNYAEFVPKEKLASHIARVRAEGFPDYDVTPVGDRDVYVPVVYPEPFEGRNLQTLGFDMYSDPVRRTAIERARDGAQPVTTGKLMVGTEGDKSVPGFVLYMPVYKRGMPSATLADRREALVGFVFCPFRMPDLMRGILGEPREDLDLEIFDIGATRESMLFDHDGVLHALTPDPEARIARTVTIEVAGRPWALHFEALPRFTDPASRVLPTTVLGIGLALSLLFAILTSWLAAARAAAIDAATHDPLTGLFNRRHMEDALKREEARARRGDEPIGIIMLDIDHFKHLNDVHGHDAGDQVLRAFAESVRRQIREEDIACRYGGEEFTVIMPGASIPIAAARAELLRAGLARLEIDYQGRPLGQITVSAGVAAFPKDGPTTMAVLQSADQALLHAKSEGRNRVVLA
jgi:diguanylate cyclase (GGDEF)-like protein